MNYSPIIWSGNTVKSLKPTLDLDGLTRVLAGSIDPTSVATLAPQGSLYLSTNGKTYQHQTSLLDTSWLVISTNTNPGDINPSSFSAVNNQSSAANITGLSFSNSIVRAATVSLSVYVNATTPLYEYFTLNLIQKASSWSMSQTSVGDSSGFTFTVTNAGVLQYTNNNYTGFTSATLKFKAITLPV